MGQRVSAETAATKAGKVETKATPLTVSKYQWEYNYTTKTPLPPFCFVPSKWGPCLC